MIYYLKKLLLTIFGRIKIYKYPMFLMYEPNTYLAKGKQYRDILRKLMPGDIIGRGYNNYLDGYFIPGEYSHTGICYRNDSDERSIVHIMACGAMKQDLIDFLRCDRFIILRPNSNGFQGAEKSLKYLGKQYDFDFEATEDYLYCHELCRNCYPDLDIKQKKVSKLFNKYAYTIDSFLESSDFTVVYEFNPNKDRY